MRMLICGNSGSTDLVETVKKLNKLLTMYSEMKVITQGCNTGTDRMVKTWCFRKGVPYFECKPQIEQFDVIAQKVAYQWIFDSFKPDMVVLFPGCVEAGYLMSYCVRTKVVVIEV